MNRIGAEEEQILKQLCNQHGVNPEYLNILILIKKEYSYKSSAKKNDLRNEIEKHIQLWAQK
jgi:hypothetical protein